MQTLKVLKSFNYEGEYYPTGSIAVVSNNDAHRLIDTGVAMLFKEDIKMMTPHIKKGYKIK